MANNKLYLKIIALGIALLYSLLFSVEAQTRGNNSQKTIAASYFEHPAMPPFITFFKELYAEHNISLEVMPMPASRGPYEVNRGTIDADIVRPISFAKNFENILILQPPIYQGEIVLLCNKAVACNQSILEDSSITVMASLAIQAVIKPLNVKSELLKYEDLPNTLNMLRYKRVDYVIYGTTISYKQKLMEDFNVITLQQVVLHHIMHKKHQDLAPLIEESIKKKLPYFKPDNFFD